MTVVTFETKNMAQIWAKIVFLCEIEEFATSLFSDRNHSLFSVCVFAADYFCNIMNIFIYLVLDHGLRDYQYFLLLGFTNSVFTERFLQNYS